MNASSKLKISRIKDEVKELHPAIDRLLSKIPEIINYEYTHGPNEMGADFVFQKQDQLLGDNVYVGIVAKIGKIGQDFTDIERQIDECKTPRYFKSGKEKVRISEVWVINTDNITHNAQRKINNKFGAYSIRFIDGRKLDNLINKYLPTYWMDLDIEISEYLLNLRNSTEDLDKKLSLVPYAEKDIYIQHDIVEHQGYKLSKAVKGREKNLIKIFEKINTQKIIFIEGDMGSGKSKLLRHYIGHYADTDVYLDERIIPVFCNFKELIDIYNGNIDEVIRDKLGDKLNTVIKDCFDSRVLLLIDSVDEKDIAADDKKEVLEKLFKDLNGFDKLRTIMTSRHLEEVEDVFQLNTAVYRYRILPLSMDKTLSFLKEICLRMKIDSRLIQDIKSSHLFKEFPKTPISAILLAKLLHENSQDLPSNMTELYSKYIELVLGRWDMDKGLNLQSQKEYQALDNILMDLAEYMISNDLQAIGNNEVLMRFTKYLNDRNLDIDCDSLFQKMHSRCEIIVIDNTNSTIAFKHRTFAEFLTAKKYSFDRSLKIDRRAFDIYWENVYFFYVGLLKDCSETIKKLVAFESDSELLSLVKIKNLGSYFLAAYTTPYDVIVDGLTKSLIEHSSMYIDIIEGKKVSLFDTLPRLPLLAIFQFIVKNSYSYNFFLEAMEDVSLKIDYSEIDEKIKAYALFFLSVIRIGIIEDAKDSFDFLLSKYHKNISMDLAFSIFNESKEYKNKSMLLKKHEKNVIKQMKKNKLYNEDMQRLFNQPIKTTN